MFVASDSELQLGIFSSARISSVALLLTASIGRAAEPGPAVDAKTVDFELMDQNGQAQTRHTLMGPKGLMLVFFRSADW